MTDAATIKRAAALIRKGIPDAEISQSLNLNKGTVGRWRREMGIKTTRAESIRSELPYFSDSEIAKQYGVSRQWVWELRKRSRNNEHQGGCISKRTATTP